MIVKLFRLIKMKCRVGRKAQILVDRANGAKSFLQGERRSILFCRANGAKFFFAERSWAGKVPRTNTVT